MNLCPKCKSEMHGVSIYVWDRGKFMHYEECPSCNYKTGAK
jgi:hypothetical protein